ncbi:uncharacterized protein LOC131887792 [Tigriopus californicus]|uniref:uncharacterized protein LOC131887792 n=1 Tax=Tigriopus californicus TaxID=6832 RepID=UPI0027DAB525|nr:uncharacterized protein LOC131887792 [Tigriopus californicus]
MRKPICASIMVETNWSVFRVLKKLKLSIILAFLIVYMTGCNKIAHWTLGKHEEQSKVIVEKWLGGSNQEILSQADLYQNDEDFDNEAILKSPPYTKMTKKSHRLDDDYGDLEITFQDLHDTRESILAVLDGISTESDNIFFVEFNDQKPEYHCIELCSIESARLQNPGAQIYIILNGMERDIFGASNPLEHHKHIRVINMNLKEFLYQEMAVTFETSFNKSTVIQSPEMRELVRSLLLYHKGGVSLEADTISVRPLPFNDNNFLSLSNNGFVNAGVLRFQPKHEFLAKVLEYDIDLNNSLLNLEPKKSIFQSVFDEFCHIEDSESKNKRDAKHTCPSSWETHLFSAVDMFATDSWHSSRGKLAWQAKGKERHPLTTLMHLQDLPKAICDSLEEVELPNMLTAMMRSACPNTFQIISSKVDDDLSWT